MEKNKIDLSSKISNCIEVKNTLSIDTKIVYMAKWSK